MKSKVYDYRQVEARVGAANTAETLAERPKSGEDTSPSGRGPLGAWHNGQALRGHGVPADDDRPKRLLRLFFLRTQRDRPIDRTYSSSCYKW